MYKAPFPDTVIDAITPIYEDLTKGYLKNAWVVLLKIMRVLTT